VIDGLGRRVAKKDAAKIPRSYLYDFEGRVVAETPGASANRDESSVFAYGTRSHVPDYMVRGSHDYRLISDAIGSVRLVIETSTGKIEQQLTYDSFGRVLEDTNPGFQPFGFAGGLYDSDTGLVRFGARDYVPEIGRWTAKDPSLFKGRDTNLYAYGANDPVNMLDPKGLWTIGISASGGGGLGVGVGSGVTAVWDGSGLAPSVLGTAGTGATYGGGWTAGIQVTTADSASDLTGWGGSVGVTIGPISIEAIYGDGYVGFGIGVGGGAEHHARADFTTFCGTGKE